MRNNASRIKRRSAILAALLVVVILLPGTWAWQSFDQQAFTPTYGNSNFGGRLHDDYDGEGIGEHNKNIYAENFGEHDLYVRVQLREYLALGGMPIGLNPEGILINDPNTWSIYQSHEDRVTERREGTDSGLIGEKGIEWVFGGEKIFMPTFNQVTYEAVDWDLSGWTLDVVSPEPFEHTTAYKMTNATGNAVDAIADGFDVNSMQSALDFISSGKQTAEGNGTRDFWINGVTRYYPVLKVNENGIIYLTEPQPHTAKSTLLPDHDGIMTMKYWRENGTPTGNFWVLDTDGWFYWASPLEPKDATSLLLQKLKIDEQRQDWEYVVTAEADFATLNDVESMRGLSSGARELWNIDNDE